MNTSLRKHFQKEALKMIERHTSCIALIFTCSMAMLFSTVALASEGQPIVRVGKHCPSGYRASGEYCVPRAGSSPTTAIEKKGSCPSGYRKSGDYCVPRAGSQDTRHVVEKKGSCPSGYRKSGEYCVERGY
jgi:hypothetical protein